MDRNAQRMYPDPNELAEPAIDAGALSLIGNAVMEQCDALDGLQDGVLNDPRQCDFDVASLACDAGSADQCLTPEQVAVAQAIYGDFRDWRQNVARDAGRFRASGKSARLGSVDNRRV